MRSARSLHLTIAVVGVAFAATSCNAKTTTAGSSASSTPVTTAASSVSGSATMSPSMSSSASTSGSMTPTAGGAAAAKAALPKAIADKGVIMVATDPTYPPIESKDGSTIVGLDPDLAAAMGDILGVKFTFVPSGFDGIVPAVQEHRFDIAMSAMSDTKKRQAAVSFVDYFSAGTSILVAKGNPKAVKDLDGLCGLTVAAEKGTVQVDEAKAQSTKCTDGGGKAVTVNAYPDQTGAVSALQASRADVVLADSPVNAYSVEQSDGKFETVAGALYDSGPYGIAFPKDSADLQKAVQLALQELIDNGKYTQILTKWKLADGAVKSATVNAGS